MTALQWIRSASLATFTLLLSAWREWVSDRCEGLAGSIAFHALLAAAPFLAGLLVLGEAVLGEGWVRAHLLPSVLAWVGPRSTEALALLLASQVKIPPSRLLTLGLASLVSLLLGAAGFFRQLQDSLETIWDVRREQAKIAVQVRKTVLSLGYALVSSLVFLAALSLLGLLQVDAVSLEGQGWHGSPYRGLEFLITFVAFWALSTFWLKILVPVTVTLRETLPWSALAATLHLLGRQVVSLGSTRGEESLQVSAATSLILMVLWFHYASMIFLYCAQLMRLHLQRRAAGRTSAAGSTVGSSRP